MRELERLREVLGAMKPQGRDGFEGLLALALDRLLDRPFRVFKSGRQPGGDMHCTTLAATVECKRYKDDIPVNDLLAAQAKAAQDDAELWVVATTTEVREPDRKMLELNGDNLNLAVGFLDWPENERLPQLALALACAPSDVAAFLAKHAGADPAEIESILSAIASAPEFQAEREKATDLFDPAMMGYGQARAACTDWLRQWMGSRDSARSQFGQPVNVTDTNAKLVRRDEVMQALQDWWNQSPRRLALLGLEGMGKTWAALSWWSEYSDDLPLTVLVMAHQFRGGSAGRLIAEAIARQVETVPEPKIEWWLRRVDFWIKAPPRTYPRILLILDGLNENPSVPWQQILGELQQPNFQRRIATLVTCRPQYWQDRLGGQREDRAPIPIGPYSERELEVALALNGLSGRKFPPGLLQHLRKPRYFRIAAAHIDKFESEGDITIERLLFRDWRDRLDSKAAKPVPLDDREFERFIQELASEAHKTLHAGRSRIFRDLEDRIRRVCTLSREEQKAVLSEIVEGRILEEQGSGHVLPSARLYHGLGLVLKREAVEAWEDATDTIEHVIAGYLDQMRGMDHEAHVLRAAASLALYDNQCPREVLFHLHREWLTAQNLSEADARSLSAHLLIDQALHLELLRWLWCEHGPSRPAVAMLLRALEQWSGTNKVADAILTAGLMASQFVHRSGKLAAIRLPTQFGLVDAKPEIDVSCHQSLGIALISMLWVHPKAVVSLKRWAIAEAERQIVLRSAVSWLGKHPRFAIAPSDTERNAMANDLVRDWTDELFDAGRLLYQTLIDADGGKEGHELPSLLPPSWALNPEASPQKNPINDLDLKDFGTPLDAWLRNGTDSGALIDEMRRQPTVTAKFIDSWLAEYRFPAGEGGGDLLLHCAMIIDNSRPQLLNVWQERIQNSGEGHATRLESRLLLPLLMPLDAKAQWAMLQQRPAIATPHAGLRTVVKRLSPEQAAGVARGLGATSLERLPALLEYLATQRPELDDGMRASVIDLIGAEDSKIRAGALALVEEWQDTRLGEMAVETGWSWLPPQSGAEIEASTGIRVVGRYGAALNYDELARRLPLQDRAWAVGLHGSAPKKLSRLAADIDAMIESIRTTDTVIEDHGQPRDIKVLGDLARHGPTQAIVTKWVDFALAPMGPERIERVPKFFLALCEAVFPLNIDLGAKLWMALRDSAPPSRAHRQGVTTSALDIILATAPDDPQVHELWKKRLEDAITDDATLDVTIAACFGGKRHWLRQAIEEDMAAPEKWRQARGFTLAGLDNDHDDHWRPLWSKLDDGWVQEARKLAEAASNRNRWARQWFCRFLDHPETAEAWVAHRLFLKTIDRRGNLWIQTEIKQRKSGVDPMRRMHHGINRPSLLKAMEAWDTEYKARWLGHTVPFGAVWPWLG